MTATTPVQATNQEPPSVVPDQVRSKYPGRDERGGLGRLVTVVIDLTDEPKSHDLMNVGIVIASAIFFGLLTAARLVFVDWHTTATTDTVRMRMVIARTISVLVLTPLAVGVFLRLPYLVTRLLWRLREDKVVVPNRADASLDRVAEDLQRRLNLIRAVVLIPTAL